MLNQSRFNFPILCPQTEFENSCGNNVISSIFIVKQEAQNMIKQYKIHFTTNLASHAFHRTCGVHKIPSSTHCTFNFFLELNIYANNQMLKRKSQVWHIYNAWNWNCLILKNNNSYLFIQFYFSLQHKSIPTPNNYVAIKIS